MQDESPHAPVSVDRESTRELPTASFKFYLSSNDRDAQTHIIDSVETVCASVFPGPASFEVVFSSEDAELPEKATIMITPSLVRLSPGPEKRYFGDFSDPERLHVLLSEDRASTIEGSIHTDE